METAKQMMCLRGCYDSIDRLSIGEYALDEGCEIQGLPLV